MSNIDKDWISAISDTVRDAEVEVDAAVWSGIERTLDEVVATPSPGVRKRYILGVISGIAAAIAISLGLFFANENTPMEQQIARHELSEPNSSTLKVVEPKIIEQMADLQKRESQVSVLKNGYIAAVAESNSVNDVEQDIPSDQECDLSLVRDTEPSNKQPKKESVQSHHDVQPTTPVARKFTYKKSNTKRDVTLLYAGGVGGGNSSSSSMMMMSDHVMSVFRDNADVSFDEIYRGSNISHHQPIGVGLRLQQELTRGLFLRSGVNYNLLASSVDMPSGDGDVKQRLHFIGIPLGVSYRFASPHNLSFYVGAGGGVEYCLAARVGSMTIDENRWHYFSDLNLGVEYKFKSGVGLYFEPSLSHYFSTTKLKSIRNDSPSTLNLQLGVSFEL